MQITWLYRPILRRPYLLAAFEGWNDAGEAASSALGHLATRLDAQVFARFDPEDLYDFQQTRPAARTADGGQRLLEWPGVELLAAKVPNQERDLVILRGHEPNLRWRTFSRTVLDAAESLGAELLVTVGALLADVPHTRPVQVMDATSDPELGRELGLTPSRYQGPTGILGVLGEAARGASLPSLSVWAALPHYVQVPNPRGALALVERLGSLLSLRLDAGTLPEQAAEFEATMAEAVDGDEELVGYVQQLEEAADASDPMRVEHAPEQLVAEVERFLRGRGDTGR